MGNLRTIFLAVVLVSAGAVCRAELIKIGFSGVVDVVGDQYNLLQNAVQAGDPITGYYIYDSLTPDSNPSSNNATYKYLFAPNGMLLSSGSMVFQSDPTNVDYYISITDGIKSGGGGDNYCVISRNNLLFNKDIYIETLVWQLVDYSYTAISNTELPSSPPDLSKWPNNDLHVSGGRGGTPPCFDEAFYITGHVDTVWLVPEPATLLLVAFGGLFLRKRS